MLVEMLADAIVEKLMQLTLARLHDKRKLGVDAVGILLVLLGRGHETL